MKNDIIRKLWQKGYILSADALEFLSKNTIDSDNLIKKLEERSTTIITKEILEEILQIEEKNNLQKANGASILKFIKKEEFLEDIQFKTIKEERKEENKKEVIILERVKRSIGEEIETDVEIIKNYKIHKIDINVDVWVSYYRNRLSKMKRFLKNHLEITHFYSLDQLDSDERDITIVGIIRDKKIREKGVIFLLEDSKKMIKVFAPSDIEEYDLVKSIPLDSVIAFTGNYYESKEIFIAEKVYYPDIPYKEQKKVEDDVWIAFTGDLQVGSKFFLEEAFLRFLKWLKGEYGNEKQKELAKKIGYIIFTGDMVDGVGVYPGQEDELVIKTVDGQYSKLQELLLEIPENIKIIIIPGNHDIVRLAEPQPPIPSDMLPELYKLENFYFLSNPSYVRIHKAIDILIYHGYSMDWFVSEIPYIRENGGYEKPENIMKFMLMLRHLAPTHGATPYIPYPDEDPLIIDPVPDIFVTGHIHRAINKHTNYNYKGVDLINASCFQDITPYQIELGHKPDPGKVVLKNLKTGAIKILNFLSEGLSNENIKR